jgi:hypothetical protein
MSINSNRDHIDRERTPVRTSSSLDSTRDRVSIVHGSIRPFPGTRLEFASELWAYHREDAPIDHSNRSLTFHFSPPSCLSMSNQSGISPTAETLAGVEDLRSNKAKNFFATFKVEGVNIVPDQVWTSADLKAKGDAEATAQFKSVVWPEFVKVLTAADGPRFAVIDFHYNTKDGRIQRTLLSVGWCPDKGTPAKQKMIFGSTKTAFEQKINIGKKYQANDEADLEYDQVFENLQRV